jgi:hypothetical protein
LAKKGEHVAVYKKIHGTMHKLCRGPLHKEGKFVPVTNFYVIQSGRNQGKFRPQCKECESFHRGTERYVKLDRVWLNRIEEIVYRVGIMETCRRLGKSQNWLYNIRKHRVHHMQRRTARQIVLVLSELRRDNVARHKYSIKYGATRRGKPERIPTQSKHFNGPDIHSIEQRRNWTKENPEREAANQARALERKRQRRAINA